MGPRVTQNWERFLTASAGGAAGQGGPAEGPQDARVRVALAIKRWARPVGHRVPDLLLPEGLETAEKRLGWSARSGKPSLKIALERLAAHLPALPSGQRRSAEAPFQPAAAAMIAPKSSALSEGAANAPSTLRTAKIRLHCRL